MNYSFVTIQPKQPEECDMSKGRRFSSDKKTATTIALRLSTLELLNALSARRNVSRSELVEHALRMFLPQEQEQEKEVGDEVAVR